MANMYSFLIRSLTSVSVENSFDGSSKSLSSKSMSSWTSDTERASALSIQLEIKHVGVQSRDFDLQGEFLNHIPDSLLYLRNTQNMKISVIWGGHHQLSRHQLSRTHGEHQQELSCSLDLDKESHQIPGYQEKQIDHAIILREWMWKQLLLLSGMTKRDI